MFISIEYSHFIPFCSVIISEKGLGGDRKAANERIKIGFYVMTLKKKKEKLPKLFPPSPPC